ncbi:hypothetical protein H072_5024 [Dactylellina haptotyla CBS 200.50]|uniref:Peptidase A1 domain-containing protein n=1 Tax=Dactylellina haptotyla (strain CBS 200.50) TaxID=1284197 RepID=S8BNM1_DACHA|nr:hypothetical protein H072_5024 [Dactylellina haptotyla CBS 200.50]
MGNRTAARSGVLISLLLLFSYFLWDSDSASASSGFSRLFPRSLKKRQISVPKYVVLPVNFDFTLLGEIDGNLYTDVQIGSKNQTLRLGVSVGSVTWVPELPDSKTSFCSNPVNAAGCRVAGTSGYYDPGNVSRSDKFTYFDWDRGRDVNATGFWTEDTIAAAEVTVDLQFGVAQRWNSVPYLGLGLWPLGEGGDRPSYIQALEQQGRIAGQYCSGYDLTASGSMILGGADLDKFTGNLTVWDNFDRPGVVGGPSVSVMSGENVITIPESQNNLTLITPDTPFLYVQPKLIESVSTLIPMEYNKEHGGYTLPCDYQLNSEQYLEFNFRNELAIHLEFPDLLSDIRVPDTNSCFALLQPITARSFDLYDFSYVLGGPFLRSAYLIVNPATNLTAIARANKNVTTSSIVELGGTFGAQIYSLQGNAPPLGGSDTNTASNGSKKSPTGAIVGGVVGSVAVVALVILAVWLYTRRKKQKKMPVAPPPEKPELPEGPGISLLDGWTVNKDEGVNGVNGHIEPGYSELPNPNGPLPELSAPNSPMSPMDRQYSELATPITQRREIPEAQRPIELPT